LQVGTGARGTVKLSFVDNASNEQGFVLQRSSDAVNWSTAATIGASDGTTGGTVSYTDSSTQRRTSYYYRVAAFNSAGASAFAGADAVTTK
jgi:hypothetical protein